MAEKDIILTTEESAGSIKISNDVITVIAGQALNEIKGVHMAVSVAEGFVDKLVKKSTQRGIRICLNDDEKTADIDVHVNIDYGVNIPDISWTIQESVKKNIETMTDISINKVNVFVDGVTIEKEPKLPKTKKVKQESDDVMADNKEN